MTLGPGAGGSECYSPARRDDRVDAAGRRAGNDFLSP